MSLLAYLLTDDAENFVLGTFWPGKHPSHTESARSPRITITYLPLLKSFTSPSSWGSRGLNLGNFVLKLVALALTMTLPPSACELSDCPKQGNAHDFYLLQKIWESYLVRDQKRPFSTSHVILSSSVLPLVKGLAWLLHGGCGRLVIILITI